MGIDLKKMRRDRDLLNQGSEIRRPKQGMNKWRVLPPAGPDAPPYVLSGKHWFPNPEGGSDIPITCMKITFDKPCSICQECREMKSDPLLRDKAKKLNVKKTGLWNMKDVDPKGDGDSFIAELPGGLTQNIINLFLDDEYGDITDPKTGTSLKITKSGSGMNGTKYEMTPFRERTEVEVPEELPDLVGIIKPPDPEYVKELMAFHLDGVQPEAEEEIDDDDYDEIEGEAEEEAPKPKPKPKKNKEDLAGKLKRFGKKS